MSALSLWLLLALVAIIDWRQRRIPNVLTLAIAAIAMVSFWGKPSLNWPQLGLNASIALLLTLPGYFRAQLGAGDVKLLLALAPHWTILQFLSAFSSGILLLACVHTLARRSSKPALLSHSLAGGSALQQRGLPLGSAVFIGYSLTLALSQYTTWG